MCEELLDLFLLSETLAKNVSSIVAPLYCVIMAMPMNLTRKIIELLLNII